MKCFEICDGRVEAGIAVEKFRLPAAGVEIDAILIGEEGRSRELGVLPVLAEVSTTCPAIGQVVRETYCPACGVICEHEPGLPPGDCKHPEETGAQFVPRLYKAMVGQTLAGHPKLVAGDEGDDDGVVIAFRTPIGFRGTNSHTGERADTLCPLRGDTIQYRYSCDRCGESVPAFDGMYSASAEVRERADTLYRDGWRHPDKGMVPAWEEFPGEVLCRGRIAQGEAGRMGDGEQLVAILPRGVVFRTGYGGRRYGAPRAHYYMFNGQQILAATWKERQLTDVF